MSRPRVSSFVAAALAIATCAVAEGARAQADGFALDNYQPSERGSDWFANESLDLRGKLRPAFGVVIDEAHKPLVAYGADGSEKAVLVRDQLYAHVGGALVFADRFRLGVNVPLLLMQTGDAARVSGSDVASPKTGVTLGDVRVGGDVRIAGAYHDPAQLAIGVQAFVPSGPRASYAGDGKARVLGRALLAGDVSLFTYAMQVGVAYRGQNDAYLGNPRGNELHFSLAAGLRLAEGKLTIGPEVWGTTVLQHGGAFTKTATPLEGVFGFHYAAGDFRFGLGGGAGLTRGLGAPIYRLLAVLEFFPAYEEEKKVEPEIEQLPNDRDHDGIVDDDDACPDDAGPKTSDPKTNGCPDKDKDGIVDKVDACVDVAGVASDDPKKNGCPADKDGDGVLDVDDACVDDPGPKTDDKETNGCPDKDKDGIVDKVDACIDEPGVKSTKPEMNGCPADYDKDGIANEEDACWKDPGKPNPDPTKNGCPSAVVVGNQIKILEQVKFATNSDVILKESDEILQGVAKVLNDHPEITMIRVEGHTDNKGTPAYNKKLSERRAASVVKWLTTKGKIDKSRLSSAGFGQEQPIDENTTEEGRKNNRRVEFHIVEGAK